LRRRYHAKRQPIQDAIDQKKKRQQNFWIPDVSSSSPGQRPFPSL
jgi:hypothetical protein